MTDSLPPSFFARPTVEVARALLGQNLVRRLSDGRLSQHRIVEVEAYTQDDPASHAFRGPSKRSAIMFGPPGHAYVYFIYGMYHCLNAVTELDGVAGAVLIRGVQGENLDGPGKLCRGLQIDLSHNGLALFDSASPLYIAPGKTVAESDILATARIGISKAQDRLWRYIVKSDANRRQIRTK
ncbi:MAG: DNA-3-methyladenine glycosylase [Cyanobacteria bacterium SZAS LIN-3]|nr:DNA-3-methyladenine glycosylase [Cyanobacteria bacterium SZAS LIN-3]MBS2005576.1 DNA-3-methyladenine glycosylase [Cyanobacteria bacterium SZAS TMP-1]